MECRRVLFRSATVVSHDGSRHEVEHRREDGVHVLTVPELGVYAIVELHDDQQL